MKVYHGSTLCVNAPLASVCRDNLDLNLNMKGRNYVAGK